MAEQNRTTLKSYFETGDTPTEAQFEDLIDSVPNISDSSVSNTEFSYLNGVTSAIQTQINGKQDELTGLTASVTELNYTDGVTSSIQTQLDGKLTDVVEDTTPQLGGNLDLNGNNIGDATAADLTKLNEVTATSTELNYVDGVTSAIQTQIDGKLSNVVDDTTPQLGGNLDLNSNDITGTGNLDITGNVTVSGEFLGDLDGAVFVAVYNNTASTINKGDAVYLTGGNNGDKPHVDLADSSDANKMPALGIVKENINPSSEGQVAVSGKINFISHGFTAGANLFVNGLGDLQETAPTGEGNLIQKIGKVVSQNIILVQGAFRSNATPNLNSGNIFIGNVSNQTSTTAFAISLDTTPQLGGDLDVNGNDIIGNPAIDGRRAIITETTTARTLSLTDSGDFIITTSGSATEVTIPSNASVAFTTGTEIDFIQKGAGELTIIGGGGVTLNGVEEGSTAITAQWGGATIKKIDTNEWVIVGKINDVA